MVTNRPSIVVFAYSEPGYACLQALISAKANILAVYTHQDDPDEEIWFHSVYDLAIKHNIPVFRPKKIDADACAHIQKLNPDIIFSFYFRRLIPDEIILRPRLGSYNLHGALLPKYRGQTCINWAVVNGEKHTGATLHLMTDKADEGDIVAQRSFDIAFSDTALDVFKHVSKIAGEMILEYLPQIESGNVKLTPQDNSLATKFGRRRPKDGLLDFSKDAITLYNLIRGVTHPFPGAFTYVNGRKLFVWWAVPIEGTGNIGEVVSTNPLCVGTQKGLLKLLTLQFENETEHEANYFAQELPLGTKFTLND